MSGQSIAGREAMVAAAVRLQEDIAGLGSRTQVLAKGGHLDEQDTSDDLLLTRGGRAALAGRRTDCDPVDPWNRLCVVERAAEPRGAGRRSDGGGGGGQAIRGGRVAECGTAGPWVMDRCTICGPCGAPSSRFCRGYPLTIARGQAVSFLSLASELRRQNIQNKRVAAKILYSNHLAARGGFCWIEFLY